MWRADLGNWVQKIENLLKDYPSPYISEKFTFAKRLAQCLNPILPYGVHLQTLRVYEILFKNMHIALNKNLEQDDEFIKLFSMDIALYSIGLFPFFQYASSQIKPKILALIQKYYLPLGPHLIPCLSGLVVAILPGLEENNEELQKNVMNTLD